MKRLAILFLAGAGALAMPRLRTRSLVSPAILFLYFTVQLGGGTLYPMIGHFTGPNAAKVCERARQDMIADLNQLSAAPGSYSISPQCRGESHLPTPPDGCTINVPNPNCPG